jgi:hypothetical protein
MTSSIGFLGLGWVVLTGLSIGFVALLGWRARQRAGHRAMTVEATSAKPVLPPAIRHGDVRLMTFEPRNLDVAHEVSAALAQLQDVALRDQVELQVVVQPGLAIRADPRVLLQMLLGIVSQAIERANGGALLVSASWHGGRTQIGVMDDGPAGDPALLASRLRDVEQCAALQGGMLEIECRGPRGNKVVLRMPGTDAPCEVLIDDDMADELVANREPRTGVLGAS